MLAIAPSGGWDVERGPDWLLVRMRNVASAEADGQSISQRLRNLLEQHFTYRLVLELDEVDELDDHLIGELLVLHQWIAKRDGVLRVCGLSPQNCRVLHSRRLDEQLPPYDDREEAVMARHATKPR
jgi:anti-anti-sigma regulatory factor